MTKYTSYEKLYLSICLLTFTPILMFAHLPIITSSEVAVKATHCDVMDDW